MLHQAFFTLLLTAICLYAAIRGGPPERIVAAVFLFGAIGSMAFGPSTDQPFHKLEVGVLLIDMVMFIALGSLALVSSRFWPMAMASMQGSQVLGHLARLLNDGTVPVAYFTLVVVWSVPMLVLLGIATRRHRHRISHLGSDYSWSWQLPPPYRAGATFDEYG